MTVNARVIRADRYTQIGGLIQRDVTALVERWATRAREEEPKARRVHHEVLLDHLPTFLWELGSGLAAAGDPDVSPHRPTALQHADQRWEAGWSLAEVVRDYRILRLVLLDHLDQALDRPLRVREAQAVGLALDEAVETSVERYVEQAMRAEAGHAAQRQQANEELRRWKEVFLHASWGVAVVNHHDLTFLAVNPAFARMHGYREDEIVGKAFASVLAPECLVEVVERLRSAPESGGHTYEAFHARKDGHLFPVLTEATIYRGDGGRTVYWAGSFQDVSERRRLEESLRDNAEALREADRRKNEFLATLAHELRNPLAPLRNCLEVVRLGGESGAALGAVREMMDRQVRQMTRLVEDLLDVTRIAQGKLVLRQEQLDLRQAVEQAVQMNQPLRQARRHQLSEALPPQPLWVEGDHARLVQVMVNLLNNAAKYTPEGGAIAVSVAREGSEAVVRVRDDGVGIPAEKLAHVFDLFAQLDLGEERAQGGLGIGLTLVRRLVELHGGSIEASSGGAGQGSEFVVRLPALTTGPAAPPAGDAARSAQKARHVLIVEDDQDGLDSLASLLRVLGHRVDQAADGRRGVEAALALRPEVALIDIGLPGFDGLEVARRVRERLGDAVVLVALTGHSRAEDREKAIQAGFDAHLAKPVDLEALQTLLNGHPRLAS